MLSRKPSNSVSGVPEHALICGLGSIGRRHLRHLRSCGVGRVDAYRTGLATLSDDGQPQPDRVFRDLEKALAEGPGLVVVANPTAIHLPVALAAVRAGCHVLVEKPLSHSLEGCAELAREADQAGVFVGVAYNMRFHPLVKRLRELIQGESLGAPLLAHAQVGGYLPDWHPWEDYRQGYAARGELGGGAALTNSHELDALLWLLGPPQWSAGTAIASGPLGTDVDEAAGFCIRHQGDAVSTANLSLVQQPPARSLAVDFELGRVEADLMSGRLSVFRPGRSVEVHTIAEDFTVDQTYHDQILAVFDGIRGDLSNIATLADGMEVLRVVERME